LILRINTALPFYQKVWQPLADLAKKVIPTADGDDAEGPGADVAESTRKALLELEWAVEFRLASGQTFAEVASVYDIAPGTLKVRANRWRDRIRDSLAE